MAVRIVPLGFEYTPSETVPNRDGMEALATVLTEDQRKKGVAIGFLFRASRSPDGIEWKQVVHPPMRFRAVSVPVVVPRRQKNARPDLERAVLSARGTYKQFEIRWSIKEPQPTALQEIGAQIRIAGHWLITSLGVPDRTGLTRRGVLRVRTAFKHAHLDPAGWIGILRTSEELHQFVLAWNWDDVETFDVLRAVLAHPKCDRGTALCLYWLSADAFGLWASRNDVPHWAEDHWDFVVDLEQRLLSNVFSIGRIKIDPRDPKGLLGDCTGSFEKAIRPIPRALLEASPGRPLRDARLGLL